MTAEDLLHAVSQLEAASGLDPWTALMRVLVSKLEDEPLPQSLLPVLIEAQRHWAGEASDLTAAREVVWRFIKAMGPSGTELESPEGRAARALLCVLHAEGDAEARSMTAEWFAAMTSGE